MSEVVATAQQGLAGKYKPYPQYKDSGVEWLGVIPTHWSLHALKRTVSGCINGIWGDEPKGEDDLIVLRVADFDRNKLTVSDDKLTYRSISEKERKTRLLKKGDLLIEKSGGGEKTLVGCVVIFDKDYSAVTSNFVAKMSPRKTYCSNFLRYAFSHLYAGRVNYPSIKQTTGIQNLDSDSYLMEHFCFPDSSDQQTIAAFLDYETARIDRLIAQQRRLIELLKEKRQAVISHAVTKGLNPNAPMKDSGVEWLGQVPEHWDVVRSKTVFNDQDNRSVSGDEELLTVSHLTGVTLRSEKDVNMFQAESLVGYKLCEKEDFVVNTMWAWMGAMGVSFTSGIVSPSYNVYRVNKSCLHASYLELLCRTPEFVSVVTSRSKGIWSSRLRIYPESLYEIRLSLPPLNEQKNIVKYVTQQTGNYAYLIDKADKGIRLMQERRTALISAAVTGKIDLRGWTPPVEGVAV
ncbi:restriction endonuclease subunit S [Aeromonas allosaccharophila]|uniref:restriction endonuclease subunit S n=1 Tax=Aeromonas allosaccharophila TaxID=656 RepID=UPI003003DFCE